MRTEVVYLSEDKIAYIKASLFEKPVQGPAPWTPPKRPAILVVPGGGYAYCSEREADPIALTFGLAGYQAFVLNYHTGDDSAYPTPLVEIAKAIAHIRQSSAAYDVDPTKIAVIGFSAGGHLAALLGSSWQQQSLADLTGLSAEDMQPNALILGYPVVNLKAFIDRNQNGEELQRVGAMIKDYSPEKEPLELINENTPPTYVFHTLEDKTLLPIETIEYIKALMANNIPCEYHLFSKGEHGLSTADSLSNFGRDFPERVHHWVPMAAAWLNDLFQYDFKVAAC